MNTTTTRAQEAVLAWVSDPGHSWLVVALDTESGFPEAEKFASHHSFIDNSACNFSGAVLLEEDCDAPAFIKAHGIDVSAVPTQYVDDQVGEAIRKLPRGNTN